MRHPQPLRLRPLPRALLVRVLVMVLHRLVLVLDRLLVVVLLLLTLLLLRLLAPKLGASLWSAC